VALILVAALLKAVNLNTFVRAGGLIPGGFTGLVLLIQELCHEYGGFHVPFSILLFAINAVPAAISFKFIGKRFTIYSVLMIFVSGLLTDWLPLVMPSFLLNFLQLQDVLLSAVFGGLLGAFAVSLCLHADATSGGTDFIAIFISEKYRKDAWSYIFAGNCVILAAAGILFSLEIALYSIIFQFTTTMAMGILYKKYQQRTLLIITNKPDEVYSVINKMTSHGATSFEGRGGYEKNQQVMLYSVVTASLVKALIPEISKIDPDAFINVFKTEQVNGRFYYPPSD
jgi:uncharacterized membrane-anchored protein YitT (DUF2179 family)